MYARCLFTKGHLACRLRPMANDVPPRSSAAALRNWLRERWQESGLSQAELARQIGTDRRNVVRWLSEEDPVVPDGVALLGLLAALGVKVEPSPPDEIPGGMSAELRELREAVEAWNPLMALTPEEHDFYNAYMVDFYVAYETEDEDEREALLAAFPSDRELAERFGIDDTRAHIERIMTKLSSHPLSEAQFSRARWDRERASEEPPLPPESSPLDDRLAAIEKQLEELRPLRALPAQLEAVLDHFERQLAR